MVKRLVEARVLASPGLKDAPVMDRMCSHFVLTLTVKHANRFNLRRDFNGLLSFTGRHLVWPQRVLTRLRAYLAQRCAHNELWSGHTTLDDTRFLERHGVDGADSTDGFLGVGGDVADFILRGAG